MVGTVVYGRDMTTHTAVHITAGRNIGTEQMHLDRWETFVTRIQRALRLAADLNGLGAIPVEVHYGTGSYEGVKEDSVKVSTYFEGEAPEGFAQMLTVGLAHQARAFEQESIALSIGPSTLVFAKA